MGAFRNAFGVVGAHPYLSVVCFLAILFGVVFVFSGGRWAEAWRSLARVFSTIFTTPFEFLRNALSVIRSAKTSESDYADTREFVLFRYSRIQYLLIFAASVLLISSGIASALVALYPQQELAQVRQLKLEAQDLAARTAQAQQTIRDAEKPGYREALQETSRKALAAFNKQFDLINQKKAANTFNGPILLQIESASNQEELSRASSTIESYFTGCPGGFSPMGYNWMAWTAEPCAQFKAYVLDQIVLKSKLLELTAAANQAQQAIDNASNAIVTSRSQLAELQVQTANNTQAQAASSVFSPRNLGSHLLRALLMLLSSTVGIILFVWIASIATDILSWIILVMRSREVEHEGRIRSAVEVGSSTLSAAE